MQNTLKFNIFLPTRFLLCVYGTAGQIDSAERRMVIAEFERQYGRHIEEAWLLFDNWKHNTFNADLFSSLIVALSLAYLTFYHLTQTAKKSTQGIQLQRKLLIALCAQVRFHFVALSNHHILQASVPGIFVFLPYILSINIPFFRIPTTSIHNLSEPLTCCFPVVDELSQDLGTNKQEVNQMPLMIITKPQEVKPQSNAANTVDNIK
uniref:G protein-coupled receptor n=1 Tax=Pristionchus pacificus TaxID=54126 RepID=A0A8R1YY47_PRIPA